MSANLVATGPQGLAAWCIHTHGPETMYAGEGMCPTQLFSVKLVRRGAYCEMGNCFVFPLRAGEPRPDMPETLRRFEVLLVGCNGGRFWGTGGGCSWAERGSEGSDCA